MFTSIMHLAFFTDQMEEMRDFYENKLGGKAKIVTKAKAYLGSSSGFGKLAELDPEKVIIVYIELAPGQFIELFPKNEGQAPFPIPHETLGYAHYSLLVEDIEKAKCELESRGVEIDTPISIGPSKTYKFWIHDPDGNKIEVMQFTDESYQIVGSIM